MSQSTVLHKVEIHHRSEPAPLDAFCMVNITGKPRRVDHPGRRYLNTEMIRATEPDVFRNRWPYPWMNPQGLLTLQGFEALLANMPDLCLFKAFFEKKRKYGQKSHNRYILEYQEELNLPTPWQAFIKELRSDLYRRFIKDLLGRGHIRFRFA